MTSGREDSAERSPGVRPVTTPELALWSETVPYERLVQSEVLRPLAARGIGLRVAVWPHSLRAIPDVVRACRDADVHLCLWPMLEDADGRWGSSHNAARYCAFASRLARELGGAALLPDELAFDLEPPLGALRRALGGRPTLGLFGRGAAATERLFAASVAELAAAGLPVRVAAMPLVALGGSRLWQRLFGTPVDGPAFARVDAMLYSSLFEGYTRGLVGRASALALVHALSRWHRSRHGPRAAVSLGCTGPGALGDERPYRSVDELALDAGAARAAGIRELALFDLGGALARPPLEAWLDALAPTHAPTPTRPARSVAARHL
ncbi:MAG: hypothetical protein IT373_07665 [Polyangiaceae bacterium]|nr:hypothetical protein [Polyangiaceae bacterium]